MPPGCVLTRVKKGCYEPLLRILFAYLAVLQKLVDLHNSTFHTPPSQGVTKRGRASHLLLYQAGYAAAARVRIKDRDKCS